MAAPTSVRSLPKGQVPRLGNQGAARVGHAHHRTSRTLMKPGQENRSGVHRPQPQMIGSGSN